MRRRRKTQIQLDSQIPVYQDLSTNAIYDCRIEGSQTKRLYVDVSDSSCYSRDNYQIIPPEVKPMTAREKVFPIKLASVGLESIPQLFSGSSVYNPVSGVGSLFCNYTDKTAAGALVPEKWFIPHMKMGFSYDRIYPVGPLDVNDTDLGIMEHEWKDTWFKYNDVNDSYSSPSSSPSSSFSSPDSSSGSSRSSSVSSSRSLSSSSSFSGSSNSSGGSDQNRCNKHWTDYPNDVSQNPEPSRFFDVAPGTRIELEVYVERYYTIDELADYGYFYYLFIVPNLPSSQKSCGTGNFDIQAIYSNCFAHICEEDTDYSISEPASMHIEYVPEDATGVPCICSCYDEYSVGSTISCKTYLELSFIRDMSGAGWHHVGWRDVVINSWGGIPTTKEGTGTYTRIACPGCTSSSYYWNFSADTCGKAPILSNFLYESYTAGYKYKMYVSIRPV